MERWAAVPGFAGYEVSDLGSVRTRRRIGCVGGDGGGAWKPLKPFRAGVGYRAVGMSEAPGVVRKRYVHRLVLEAFVGPCPPRHEALHRDGDRTNNTLANLRWGTKDENAADRVRHGTTPLWTATPYEPVWFADPFIPLAAIVPAEVWAPVPGMPGYEASNFGNFRSWRKRGWQGGLESSPRPIRPGVQKADGRAFLVIKRGGKTFGKSAGRAVLEAFTGEGDRGIDCRHLDGNPANNHLSNLRWGTRTENMRDRTLHGTDNRGERCGSAQLTVDEVREIRRRRAAGESGRVLADEFGVTQATICDIHKGRSWSHV